MIATPRPAPVLLLMGAMLALPAAAWADADEAPAPIVLFDGETLDGWKAADFYKPGEVSVKDGAIILAASEVSGGMTGITTTREDLPTTNYEFSYRAKRLSGRDFFAAATFPVGENFLTLVNGGWGGSVTGLSSIDGADASENLTGTYQKYADDTWYSFRIRVTDAAIECWIDDEKLITFEDPGDHHLDTRLETRVNHPLGFATWQTGGAVKDIVVRPLAAEEIPATSDEDR
ncbi:DUF1080 domain-containing protein [Tautonia sp. JC769]|uniref:3-keto-disaccharide hydrolase n=1 Tax=Tautonia sp. JC769 TaxID=3232135 RepID=UPI00345AA37C